MSPDFYVYGLASSGTATYTASAAGFTDMIGTVNLRPSGFVLVGPGGLGASSFLSSVLSGDTRLAVRSALLNTDGSFLSTQSLAGGHSVDVAVTTSNADVGTITTSPVAMVGGSSSGTTAFHPVGTGAITLSLDTPPGFTTPVQFQTIAGTIVPLPISLTGDTFNPVTIGSSLEIPAFVATPRQPVNAVVTLTSNNPSTLKLSNTSTGAGSASIQVTIPAGSAMGLYFLQSFGSSGIASYTATGTGFDSRVADQITLASAGVVISGPLGLFTFQHKPAPANTSLEGGPLPITIWLGIVHPDGTSDNSQQLAGGQPLIVQLTNSNPSIGTISQTAVIQPGTDNVALTFTPLKVGQTILTITQPPGFTAPTHGTTILDEPFTTLVVNVR